MSRTLIAKNAAALMLSDVVVRAASAAGVVLVARSLGPRSYGILSVAIALSSILGYLSDLGLTPLTIQLATRPLADVGCILGTVFKARLALVAALVLASLAGILVSFPASEQRAVMLAVVLPTIGGMAMQGFAASYFVATQQLHVIASLKAASQAFSATALIFAFFFRWQVSVVAPIYGVTSLLGGIACLWMVRSRAPKMSGWDPRLLKGFAAFTVSGLTASSLPQMGPVIMGRVTASAQIGFFAAASRIPSVLYAIPACLGLAWYPQLFHAGSRDPARHFALSADQLKLNAILGFGLSLPTALYARPLIHLDPLHALLDGFGEQPVQSICRCPDDKGIAEQDSLDIRCRARDRLGSLRRSCFGSRSDRRRGRRCCYADIVERRPHPGQSLRPRAPPGLGAAFSLPCVSGIVEHAHPLLGISQ